MRSRHVLVCLLFTAVTAASWSLHAAAAKVGIVDVQRVLDSVEEGKRAKRDFEGALKDRRSELERRKKEVEKAEEQFEKQKLILSAATAEEKRAELETKKVEFQQYWMTIQAEMQKKEAQLGSEIIAKITGVVEEMGKKGTYDFILEKNAALFYKDAFDVTSEVITQYNQRHK